MSAASAPRALRRAAQLLRRERALWPWVIVPFALNLAAFALATALLVRYLDALAAPLESFLQVSTPIRGLRAGALRRAGLSFVCMPWLVCAGTLLTLELGPPEKEP